MNGASERMTPLLDWLMSDGRLAPSMGKFVDQLMTRAVAAGLPIWRFYIGLRVMHPQMAATGILWRRGGGYEEIPRAHGILETSAYIGSPMQAVRESGKRVRFRLGELPDGAHGLLNELVAGGGTDYVAYPMRMSRDMSSPVASFATDRPDGFSDQDLADLERLVDWMGAIAEIHFHRNIAETVIDTYLGHIVGEQILGGLIKRGDGREINAVLWFSDLRDFTGLNERMAAPELLELLNNYLQLVGDALAANGGEILKFIGDGLLAIFPLSQPQACANLLHAVAEARQAMVALNEKNSETGRAPLNYGIGVHVGDVMYGNIGSRTRLDFTVIGPAVNMASRLESLTKQLGRTVLLSRAFADFVESDFNLERVGEYPVRGFNDPIELFAYHG